MSIVPKIYEDSRQQVHSGDKHAVKHAWWAAHGVEVERVALTLKTHAARPEIAPAGDYCADCSNVCVDTKASVDEVASNINGKEHGRFIAELRRAADAGYRIVILVENDLGYANLGDVVRWENGHCATCYMRRGNRPKATCDPRGDGRCLRHDTRKPIQGARLYKAMDTIERRYGCRFEFCAPNDSARRICELLGVDYER